MEPTRALTVHFMDGTKVSYGFPTQAANAAARQIKLEEWEEERRSARCARRGWLLTVGQRDSRALTLRAGVG